MSEATEKQREPASSDEELATSLYRDGRGIRAIELRLHRAHRRARLRRLLAPGHRPGGTAGRRRRRAAPRRLALLRPPRPRLRAGQGHVARRRCSATSSAAPAAASAARAAARSTSSTPSVGVLGQGGTLGSNFVLGAGAAISAQLLGNDRVIAIFFGDGAAARGTFHEAALPGCGLEAAGGLGLREQRLGDLGADHRAEPDREHRRPRRRLRRARRGRRRPGRARRPSRRRPRPSRAPAPARGPTLIEAKTLRIRGHYEGDSQPYRDRPQPTASRSRATRWRSCASTCPRPTADALDEEARAEVEAALEEARRWPRPRPDPSVQSLQATSWT